jgi:hypothetical protein
MHQDTDAAAVDLAGAQFHELADGKRKFVLRRLAERLHRLHGLRQDEDGMFHSGLHDRSPIILSVFDDIAGHIGRLSFVIDVTERREGM